MILCRMEGAINNSFFWKIGVRFICLNGKIMRKKCKPNVEKKIEIIDNMSDKEFGDYLTGKTDIEI